MTKHSTRLASTLHPLLYSYLRHFPVQRGKHRLLHRMGTALLPPQHVRRTKLKIASIEMECDLQHFIQRQLYYLGDYEAEHVGFWMRCARQATTIFDVGANVGLYALAAAASHPHARIHAFEPTPELVARLRTNIALNQFDNILINPVAVGRRSGEIYLHYSGGRDGDNEGMNYVSREVGLDTGRLVPMTSLDDYCHQHQIEAIDLLKIDIEGSEYDALCGAERLLARNAIGCMFMELNSWAVARSGHALTEIVALLSNYGFRFYQIRYNRLVEIADRHRLVDTDVVAISATTHPLMIPFRTLAPYQ